MMNYLEKKKKALMNYVSAEPSGYDVTIQFHSNNYTVDVTINGVTTTYTMGEVQANPVDLGCAYLTYRAFSAARYDVISKGTVDYNGNTITKGKQVLSALYSSNDTFTFSGTDEPTPSGVTEWYMINSARTTIFTDTDVWFGQFFVGVPHQFGCIEWTYGSGACKIYALKPLTYNGVNYNTGDLVRQFGYGTVTDMIFEEI